MHHFKYLMITLLIITGLTSIKYALNSINAIPSEFFLDDEHVYGPLIGTSVNKNGSVDWVMVGNWRAVIANASESDINLDIDDTPDNQSLSFFNAAIEMIKPDGTTMHTHALTDFTTSKISLSSDNSTVFNGTSTISLRDGPAVDIPTTIQRSNNGNVYIINIDPESVDNHFGDSPLIYGVNSKGDFANLTSHRPNPSNLDLH